MNDPRDSYAEGMDAFIAGLDETKNPYNPDSDDYLSWNDGFAVAAEEAEAYG